MNYAKLDTCSMVNGDGLGVDLFVSGCSLGCKGCFNKKAQDPSYGAPFTEETMHTLLDALESPYIQRLSLLGGDPLEPCNIAAITQIVKTVRGVYGDSKKIWMWTGRLYADVRHLPVMKYIDVLIDGPFELDKKIVRGKYFGSENQRIYWLR